MSVRLGFFVDPACLWSWLTSRWLVQVAPQRDLDIQWRSYSLLLRDGTRDSRIGRWRPAPHPTGPSG